MKKIICLSLLCLMLIGYAQAQTSAITKFYQKYENDENFTVVYVSQHMFGLFADLEVEDEEDKMVMDILKDLKGLHILVTEKDAARYYKESIALVKDPAYEVLMKVREEDTNVQFFVKKQGKIIEELLLLVQDDNDEFVLMSIVGKIDLNKIAHLSKAMDIEGLQHLKHVPSDH